MKFSTALLVVCAAIFCAQPALAQKAKTERKVTASTSAVKKVQLDVPKAAQEPQVDFDDLIANDAGGSQRTIYAEGAANLINTAVESYGESHDAAMSRKRASSSSSSGGSSDSAASRSPPSSSGSSRSSSGSKSFVCTYKCTNASFTNTEKTTLSVRVSANDASTARDEAAKHARSTCYEQTKRVFDAGSANCREQ